MEKISTMNPSPPEALVELFYDKVEFQSFVCTFIIYLCFLELLAAL